MSDTEWSTRPGITGVRAIFGNDAAMQDAVDRLTLQGFDRADLTTPVVGTPALDSPPPPTEVDGRQARTLATSMAGVVGALAAAGATIATGGAAALAVAAAAAAGAGAAGAANLASSASMAPGDEERAQAAERGQLVLMVRTRSPELRDRARSALRLAGAADLADVTTETPSS